MEVFGFRNGDSVICFVGESGEPWIVRSFVGDDEFSLRFYLSAIIIEWNLFVLK